MTTEELRQFAGACGYSIHPEHDEYYDSRGKHSLCRFTWSKDAVLDALERFCSALEVSNYEIESALPFVGPRWYAVRIGKRPWQYSKTLNEAVINAVLQAQKAK